MKPYGLRPKDHGCCPGHDKPPAKSRDRRVELLDDWEDKGHDTAGYPVTSRPFCWNCLGTGSACCFIEGCGCCTRCNPGERLAS